MKLHPKRAVALTGALAVAAGLTLASTGVAFAAAPYNPDTNSVGSITFTDANGVPVTSGSVNSPIAAYVTGSKLVDAGDTDGTVEIFLPVFGQPTATWSGDSITLDTPFNPAPAAWPADIKSLVTAGKPVVNEASSDLTIAGFEVEAPNTATTGPNTAQPTYQNLYQVRLYTGSNTAQYDSADVSISGTTWTLVPNPTPTVNSTTTISANPATPGTPVTLTSTVTPSGSVASGYIGGIGTLVVTNNGTPVDTEIIAPGSAAPFTVTTHLSPANPSNNSFTATFTPFNGTALNGSASAPLPYNLVLPADATSTTLGVVAGPHAGDNVTYTGAVTDTAHSPATAVTGGTVNLFDNGSITPLNSTPLNLTAGAYTFTNTFALAGPHSVVAVYSGVSGTFATSSSAPATFSQSVAPGNPCDPAIGGQCTDVQTITGKIPTGVLSISTPYTATAPLDLGTLALDPTDTYFTAHHFFGFSQTDPAQDILITDTRAGNLPWTAQAQASTLTDGASNPGSTISGENVGLDALTVIPVSGNGFNGTAANFTTIANPAATPPVAPADAGFAGLGNEAHDFAQAQHGLGTVGLLGTLTLNAPSSTEAGQFTGTVTFTLVGSIVANAH
jgi:hypothetical protein